MFQLTANHSLRKHNTFGIECHAATFATYEVASDVQQILQAFPGTRYLPIGMGSNLLFLAPRFEGVVLHCENRQWQLLEESDTEVLLCVGAGWNWDEFVRHTLHHGWYGLENLSYIPGETGASAVQNVGAFGVEARERVAAVEAVDLRTGVLRRFTHEELQFAYRDSFFKHPDEARQWAIVWVTYRLDKTFTPNLSYAGVAREVERRGLSAASLTAQEMRDLIIDVRRGKLPDPAEIGSAGSFFKNPIVSVEKLEEIKQSHPGIVHFPVSRDKVKLSAGWMIDRLGWRGRSMGPAGVYDRQALVIVNYGGAVGADVLNVCRAVQHDVSKANGVQLEPEVNFIE